MWTVFKKSIRNRRGLFIILVVISLLLLWTYVALTPALGAQMESVNRLMEILPKEFLTAFDIDTTVGITFEGLLISKQYSMVWPIIVMILVNGIAIGTIAGEIEKGTMNLLLAQPVSRRKIFWGKYFAGLFMLILFTALTVLSAIPMAEYYKVPYQKEHFFTFAIIALLFSWSIYSVGFLFSSMVKESSRATIPTMLFLLISYSLKIVSELKPELKDLKLFSIFHYYNPTLAMVYNQLDQHSLLIFFGIIIVCTFLAAQIFQRRDINA